MLTFGHANHYRQYFEGFKPSADSPDPKEVTTVELNSPLGSDESTISDALLAKQKKLEELKTRAMEKDLELRALESTLAQKGEERKADIEMLKNDLGNERQAWMTPEDG